MSQLPPPLPPDPASQAVAPPIIQGKLGVNAKPAKWWIIIGIIAIVFGAGGIFSHIWGVFTPFVMDWFSGAASGVTVSSTAGGGTTTTTTTTTATASTFDPFAGIGSMKWWMASASLLLTLAAVWLLIGGIWLLQCKHRARSTLISWSIVKILIAVFATIVTALVQRAQFATMGNAPGTPIFMASFGSTMVIITAVFSIVWGWALPIFMLIWFRNRFIANANNSCGKCSQSLADQSTNHLNTAVCPACNARNAIALR